MATITRFEDLEIWKLARIQTNDFNLLIETTSLAKDYELRNQMSRSSGSAMDNIAEGFERSGNQEFKNFLIIAKGFNGEYRSQLYRSIDKKYISNEKFDELYIKNTILGNKTMSFITYLQHSNFKGQSRKPNAPTSSLQTSNFKPQTSNDVFTQKFY